MQAMNSQHQIGIMLLYKILLGTELKSIDGDFPTFEVEQNEPIDVDHLLPEH